MISPELIEFTPEEKELIDNIEAQVKPLFDMRTGMFMAFIAARKKKGGGIDYKDGKLYWIPPNEEMGTDKETK